jgi:hypothetical protein
MVPTLGELGLHRQGNYLAGDKGCVRLNETGAARFNLIHPSSDDNPTFSKGNRVDIYGKLPEQTSENLKAEIVIHSNNKADYHQHVLVDTDNFFAREIKHNNHH